jgi:hypothetical protein
MILRRFSQALKDQNWTTIAIEFVLLVAGVFLGIQVANWNEQRQFRAQERELLGRLRIEIRQNIASAQEKARFFETVYQSADRTYAFLGNDAPCASDCWQRVVDVFYASQWRDLRPTRDTFDEMERLGLPRDARLKLALANYYGLYESMVTITSQLPRTQQQLWRTCHRIVGMTELLAADCPAALGEGESRELIEQLRAQPSLRPALAYWMSTVSLTRPALDQQIAGAQAVLVSIDSELGD